MNKNNVVDLSNIILNITFYIVSFSLILNIALGVYFDKEINIKTMLPMTLLLFYCNHNTKLLYN